MRCFASAHLGIQIVELYHIVGSKRSKAKQGKVEKQKQQQPDTIRLECVNILNRMICNAILRLSLFVCPYLCASLIISGLFCAHICARYRSRTLAHLFIPIAIDWVSFALFLLSHNLLH